MECHRKLGLPNAPKHFIQYLEEDNRPQVSLDVNYENGFGVSLGRLREDTVFVTNLLVYHIILFVVQQAEPCLSQSFLKLRDILQQNNYKRPYILRQIQLC